MKPTFTALMIAGVLALGGSAFGEDTATQPTPTDTTTNTVTEKSDREEKKSGISPGGLFLEPILSYSQEDSSIQTGQLPVISDDTSGTSKSYGVGARIGIHASEILFVGADARFARTSMADSSLGDVQGNSYNVGPTLGLQMPVFGLRIWGSYVAAGEYNPEAGNNDFDLKFKEARGPRYGAGIRLASLRVNLEYQDLTYNTTEIESFGSITNPGSSKVDFKNEGYTLSLSFPVEL